MHALDWFGIGAVALLALVFYQVRQVRTYVAAAATIVVIFGVATVSVDTLASAADRWLMISGLFAFALGLLIVRIMLIRSVSLLLLGSLGAGPRDLFQHDIQSRLDDMRHFGLIARQGDRHELTSRGRLIAALVAISYALLGIRS